jgi:pilus assembly protein Flp/PilA
MLNYAKGAISAVRSLVLDRRAVTAMEYALIAALVAVVMIGSLTTVGTNLKAKFVAIAAALT